MRNVFRGGHCTSSYLLSERGISRLLEPRYEKHCSYRLGSCPQCFSLCGTVRASQKCLSGLHRTDVLGWPCLSFPQEQWFPAGARGTLQGTSSHGYRQFGLLQLWGRRIWHLVGRISDAAHYPTVPRMPPTNDLPPVSPVPRLRTPALCWTIVAS